MANYLYIINYSDDEKELCNLEMRSIFGVDTEGKNIVSRIKINPSESPYIKERVSFIYEENSYKSLENKIKSENIRLDDFKVNFIKTEEDNTEYKERLKIVKEIGMCIEGEAEIYNPKWQFAVCCIKGKWIFGGYEKHNNDWNIHEKKPCNYSNSLNYRVSRALINIATENRRDISIIDPCCGVGTVLLEGVSLGYNIKGYEINPLIGERAKTNLRFFDYKDVVEIVDMNKTNEHFDVSIVDIPYGLFNPITKKEQENIIRTTRRISDKMVLISYEEVEDTVRKFGFRIINKCSVNKGKFRRYVTVCI